MGTTALYSSPGRPPRPRDVAEAAAATPSVEREDRPGRRGGVATPVASSSVSWTLLTRTPSETPDSGGKPVFPSIPGFLGRAIDFRKGATSFFIGATLSADDVPGRVDGLARDRTSTAISVEVHEKYRQSKAAFGRCASFFRKSTSEPAVIRPEFARGTTWP